ncbi:MAG: hypothetical protein AAGF12_15330 [Myxococcota bacterium]
MRARRIAVLLLMLGCSAEEAASGISGCPSAPPLQGRECRPFGATCVYPGPSRCAPELVARCVGTWSLTMETPSCAVDCPADPPSDNGACIGSGECVYRATSCGPGTASRCEDGRWTSASVDAPAVCLASCPNREPLPTAACDGLEGLSCRYSSPCEPTVTATCIAGGWIKSELPAEPGCFTSCPPQPPIEGQLCAPAGTSCAYCSQAVCASCLLTVCEGGGWRHRQSEPAPGCVEE